MTNIEKLHVIDGSKLSGEEYFMSLLKEAYGCGLLNEIEIERLQMECISLLAYKTERYNSGDSSSIRVETAESIMKSNLYTIGLYLKSLPDADSAVDELKAATLGEIYQKGRELLSARFRTAESIYILVQNSRIITPNYSYNATLSENGIESFFKLYNPDFEAHEAFASIDYQLCNPVFDLGGVEYIQKYLVNLLLENEFCRCFEAEVIHYLLSGYDIGYKDLLINIFEQILIGALGCALANRSVIRLYISEEGVQYLQDKLSEYNDGQVAMEIGKAAGKVQEELRAVNPSLRSYIAKSLPKITTNIISAVKTGTLDKIFVSAVNSNLEPRIAFVYDAKMKDEDYREFIDEMLSCRYPSDKLELMKEKIKTFGDFMDLLFDAQLTEEEIKSAFGILGNVELAALLKRYPFKSGIHAVDLSEAEQNLMMYLKSYIDELTADRQKQIFEILNRLIDE